MSHNFKDLTGLVFGRLTIISKSENKNATHIKWHCECECGVKKEISSHHLTSGHTVSCGCYVKEISTLKATKHGLRYTKGYLNFQNSKRRAGRIKRTPTWLTDWDKQMLKEIYQFCPEGFEVDHIIPLQGKLVSGLHVPENLQYLYAPLNHSKSNKFEVEK